MCSGKTFYGIRRSLAENSLSDHTDTICIEQLAPFPLEKLQTLLSNGDNKNVYEKVVWAQEEPKNMGFWSYVAPRINKIIKSMDKDLIYCGRDVSDAPAAGTPAMHEKEQNKYLQNLIECLK